jgi:periplasmic divalent cation tolerance protein
MFIVLTYVSSLEQARVIAAQVLRSGFAVCINIGSSVESHYVWEGKRCAETEIPISMKVVDHKHKELKEYLEKIHPYQLPAILDWPVTVNHAYEAWANSNE